MTTTPLVEEHGKSAGGSQQLVLKMGDCGAAAASVPVWTSTGSKQRKREERSGERIRNEPNLLPKENGMPTNQRQLFVTSNLSLRKQYNHGYLELCAKPSRCTLCFRLLSVYTCSIVHIVMCKCML